MTVRTSRNPLDRRDFIGGSDARIIMGQDEKALRTSPPASSSSSGW